ncbi:unnamed protein product [Discosporangium mesarthrocarpum]
MTQMMAGDLDAKKGVSVTLPEYKEGAIEVRIPHVKVSEEQVEAALANAKKPYRLVPVRFVEEGGTKMGHTVIINWEAKVNGKPVPGGKRENFPLELKEGQGEPWDTFTNKIAVGMGQMETKVFPASFPSDFKVRGGVYGRGKRGLREEGVQLASDIVFLANPPHPSP